jgi:hypothetical protein
MTDTAMITTMATSMREFADFLDANPDVAALLNQTSTSLYIFSDNDDDFRSINAQLGSFDKRSDSYGLEARKRFGKITLVHSVSHEAVCEKVVTGTRVVKKLVPATEVEMIEVEEIEEITEWVCPETWR